MENSYARGPGNIDATGLNAPNGFGRSRLSFRPQPGSKWSRAKPGSSLKFQPGSKWSRVKPDSSVKSLSGSQLARLIPDAR
eukprot:10250170-Alexandrium_andersonii.AAC.1